MQVLLKIQYTKLREEKKKEKGHMIEWATLYSISDRKKPKMEKETEFEKRGKYRGKKSEREEKRVRRGGTLTL